jgi:hypothetical protein
MFCQKVGTGSTTGGQYWWASMHFCPRVICVLMELGLARFPEQYSAATFHFLPVAKYCVTVQVANRVNTVVRGCMRMYYEGHGAPPGRMYSKTVVAAAVPFPPCSR